MFSFPRAFPPILFATLFVCIGLTHSLKCYKCGQYNEGVGSITPCINYTAHMHLKECLPTAEWCIKYVSEGSTVRDCVPVCTEKEAWSTRTYCCQEDGCNSAPSFVSNSCLTMLAITMAALLMLRG
ncbi:U-scoloptoxin(05)-Sm1a [Bombus fervidus]|uniref:U-scoloptoxin(05)-Sm1a n=1 Tax=Bombus fervidus TaxID=203811 RepID=UPI003AB3DD97